MSDLFADRPPPPPPEEEVEEAVAKPRRPFLITIALLGLLLIGFNIFTRIWTERLWFVSLDYGSVFTELLTTRVVLFVVFGLVMAVTVCLNIVLAYRFRPQLGRVAMNTPEQANLAAYRRAVNPVKHWLLLAIALVLGSFSGLSAAGQWRTYLMWAHRQPFDKTDPYFDMDLGFYVFSLPWWHFVVDFCTAALVVALIASAVAHYLYGGIQLQAANKVGAAAQVQMAILVGLLLLLRAADYWLSRFDLATSNGGLIDGMTYTADRAVLPGRNILLWFAVFCAVVVFVSAFRRRWLLPGVALSLFVISSIVLGLIWPALMQRFVVKPDEPDKEAPYVSRNIEATRDAFNLKGITVTDYNAETSLSQSQLNKDAASLPGIRLVDPQLVSDTFEQLQQVRNYYTMPTVLDVDRYEIDGQQRDVVLAAREMYVDGLPEGQKTWANMHTVYTHGFGIVAAFGNQQNANNQPIDNDGEPVWAEKNLPPTGDISDSAGEDGYRGEIYFGENSPEYSIVGKVEDAKDIELDMPEGSDEDSGKARSTTYEGKDGVEVGSLFKKLLYATKFGDANILLSNRVNENSKILYDREPSERVRKVAPWLTVDSDALPAVVNGKVVWLLDGYTLSDAYPNSNRESLKEMTSDSTTPPSAYSALANDEISYMRNSVKAVVDAYDGTVTLYEWDDSDPILKSWMEAFPDVVKPRDEIDAELLKHMRYPEDLYKVQREMFASYHVSDPLEFTQGNDRWQVPQDPNQDKRKQPPYRLSVAPKSGEDPVFSLTSTYVPSGKQNLAAFMSVGADASDPDTYGTFNVLRLPDNTQVPGPGQIANQFQRDDQVAQKLLAFKRQDVTAVYGNLLTLPVGDGLLYVQPLYTKRESGEGNYPGLAFVLVSFGRQVGIGSTLGEALEDILSNSGSTNSGKNDDKGSGSNGKGAGGSGDGDGGGQNGDSGETAKLPKNALKLLIKAEEKFAEADQALNSGDLAGYQEANDEARKLVERALEVKQKR